MSRKRIVVAGLAILLGAYAMADAWDVAPGALTTKPLLPEPEPYPTLAQISPVAPEFPVELGPAVDPVKAEKLLGSFVSDERVTGTVSFALSDPVTGERLVSFQDGRGTVPASNMKILTAAAALDVLGPDRTLPTTVKVEGNRVFLVGGGDVLLNDAGAAHMGVAGRGSLADLAKAVAPKLDPEVSVFVDSSLFEGPLYHADVQGPDTAYVMALRPLAVNEARDENGRHMLNGDLLAAEAFAEALEAEGVKVAGVDRGVAPAAAQEMARVESAPVRDLVALMLRDSDNTIAEVLGHLVAIESGKPATFAGAGVAVSESLAANGFTTAGLVLADSSGLSISNRVTAGIIDEILVKSWNCDGCSLAALPDGMPVAGLDGTLWNRFRGTEAEGAVRAKTGTLIKANSLSGYLYTDAGRPLVFSLLIDGIDEGASTATRSTIDEFVSALTDL